MAESKDKKDKQKGQQADQPAIKYVLSGAWFGHPLHPVVVNMPVGLWTSALVFDALALAGYDPAVYARMSLYGLILGLLSAVVAIPTGLNDWWEIKPEKPAYSLGIYHLSLNAAATLAVVVNTVWRLASATWEETIGVWPLVFSAVGAACVLIGAYLGGRMVYDQGTAIARMSKAKWRKIAIAEGSAVPEK